MNTIAVKRYLIIFMLAAAVLKSFCAFAETQPPVSVVISTPQKVIENGNDAQVVVTMKNLSGKDVEFIHFAGAGHAESVFNIDVWYRDGRPVPYTEYGRHDLGLVADDYASQNGMAEGISMHSGEQYSDRGDIGKIFDITDGGEYLVQAEFQWPKEFGDGITKSNVITIDVKKPSLFQSFFK